MDQILHDQQPKLRGCVFDNPSPLCQCGGCFSNRQAISRAKWLAERVGDTLRRAVDAGTATVAYAGSLDCTKGGAGASTNG